MDVHNSEHVMRWCWGDHRDTDHKQLISIIVNVSYDGVGDWDREHDSVVASTSETWEQTGRTVSRKTGVIHKINVIRRLCLFFIL